jgi:hypothetical protein
VIKKRLDGGTYTLTFYAGLHMPFRYVNITLGNILFGFKKGGRS